MSHLTPPAPTLRRATLSVTAAAVLLSPAAAALGSAHAAGTTSGGPSAHVAHKKAKAVHRKKTTKTAKAKAGSAVTLDQALANVPVYSGPTGAIVHSKSVSTSFKSTDDPQESRGDTVTMEQWAEVGGGNRVRQILSFTDPDTGESHGGNDSWRTPWTWVVVPAAPSTTPPSEAVFCNKLPSLDPIDPLLAGDQANLATLPDGGVINGVPTKVGEHVLGPDSATRGVPASSRLYLNATTGALVRSVFRVPGAVRDSVVNDYSLWEVQPAGGSAAALTGKLPANTVLGTGANMRGGCVD